MYLGCMYCETPCINILQQKIRTHSSSFQTFLCHYFEYQFITLYNVCSVHRGCSVHRRISVHRGDTMSTSGDITMHVGEQIDESLSISIENHDVLIMFLSFDSKFFNISKLGSDNYF